MDKKLSIYLDLTRFLAAMTVFLAHAAGPLTQGFLWQMNWYPDVAVMIFFVMSGFVIAFVSDIKEKTFSDYFIARAARLFSIVIPALLLTFAADQIGLFVRESLYYNGPWGPPKENWLNYAASLLMINHIWSLGLSPGTNSPFWSISFELIYYISFASFFYLKGKKRFFYLFLALVFGGPDVAFLFPIWCMGALTYYVVSRRKIGHSPFYSLVSLASLIILILITPALKDNTEPRIPFLLASRKFIADYVYATLFTIHLLFVPSLLNNFEKVLLRLEKPIAFFASLTFSLYLFHLPLMKMMAAFFEDNSSFVSRFVVLVGTFLFILIIGRYFEQKKYLWKKLFIRVHDRFTKKVEIINNKA